MPARGKSTALYIAVAIIVLLVAFLVYLYWLGKRARFWQAPEAAAPLPMDDIDTGEMNLILPVEDVEIGGGELVQPGVPPPPFPPLPSTEPQPEEPPIVT